MAKINRGWLRLYLFYGTIFFLLGLTGYGVSNQTITGYFKRYAVNSGQYIQNVKEYSLARDFGFETDDTSIVVNARQYAPSILFAHSLDLLRNNPDLLKEIQYKITANFSKVKIVALPGPWGKKLENLFSQYELSEANTVLIGFDLFETTNQCGYYKVMLIMPDFLAKTLASRILLSFMELFPEITFEDHAAKMGRVLSYSWKEARGDSGNYNLSSGLIQATDLLIQILQQNLSSGVKI